MKILIKNLLHSLGLVYKSMRGMMTNDAAASSLILFHCSGKECRPQEPCEFPESANNLSSTSVYINQEFSKPANSICYQEDKENPGYEHFDNSNVAASLLLKLFRCSGKVGRLQEPCEFPESANILSSTSVYINEEFSKPTISMCNQEDKENAGYENFDNANVAASLLMLFRCSSKESRLQESCEFPESANILSSTSVYINQEFSKPTTSMCT
jgi:hypothetical protein